MKVFRGFHHPDVARACALTIGNFAAATHRPELAQCGVDQTVLLPFDAQLAFSAETPCSAPVAA